MATLKLTEPSADLLQPQERIRINPEGRKLQITIRNAEPGTGTIQVKFEAYDNIFRIEDKEIVSFSLLDLNSEVSIKNIGNISNWIDFY